MTRAGIELHPQPGYLAAFTEIMKRIEKGLGSGRPHRHVIACVAGGAALHFYTGTRVTRDIDASFNARLILPPDLRVAYRDADGGPRMLYFDTQYNDTLGLRHPDAADDALPIRLEGVDPNRLDVRLLNPVDLAVSKLGRFGEQDREDIVALAKAGLITSDQLRDRAEDVLPGYVGNTSSVRTSIDLACKAIEDAVRLRVRKGAGAAPRTGKPRSRPRR